MDTDSLARPQVPRDRHVAGLAVMTRPAQVLTVAGALEALENVEVRAIDPAGKLVVVCEGADEDALVAAIGRMRDLAGVLNVALVYQHAEPADAMEEEIGE